MAHVMQTVVIVTLLIPPLPVPLPDPSTPPPGSDRNVGEKGVCAWVEVLIKGVCTWVDVIN